MFVSVLGREGGGGWVSTFYFPTIFRWFFIPFCVGARGHGRNLQESVRSPFFPWPLVTHANHESVPSFTSLFPRLCLQKSEGAPVALFPWFIPKNVTQGKEIEGATRWKHKISWPFFLSIQTSTGWFRSKPSHFLIYPRRQKQEGPRSLTRPFRPAVIVKFFPTPELSFASAGGDSIWRAWRCIVSIYYNNSNEIKRWHREVAGQCLWDVLTYIKRRRKLILFFLLRELQVFAYCAWFDSLRLCCVLEGLSVKQSQARHARSGNSRPPGWQPRHDLVDRGCSDLRGAPSGLASKSTKIIVIWAEARRECSFAQASSKPKFLSSFELNDIA